MKICHTIIAVAFTALVPLSAFAQKPSSDNTNVIAIDIKSDNSGSSLYGTMYYSNEGPIPFYGKLHENNGADNVTVQNKFGDEWQPAGRWVIGGRDDRHVVAFDVSSKDNGKSLNGTMAYAGEGEIRVRSKRGNGIVYDVNNQFGGPLHDGGAWVLGARGDKKQYLVAIDISSKDEGKTFGGTITYDREGPLDFRATQLANNGYRAEVYFANAWHADGDWIIGGRDKRAVKVSVKSTDGGKTLSGSMTYRGEGPIGLEATISGGSAYTVENQWGSTNSSWNPGGVFVLGSRIRIGGSAAATTFTNSIGMQFKRIPAGKFLMGSPISEKHHYDNEHQHEVTISRDYHLGINEVTQSQWEKIMGTTPWKGEERVRQGADIAANYISWNDAVKFCEKLSKKEGRTYRLPTEAEWEYACRAGSKTAFGFGDDHSLLKKYAWYYDNAKKVGENYAHKVAQKRPNGFGLYGMHGNVSEFCQDWLGDYPQGRVTDPVGPSKGSRRVVRGGYVESDQRYCRSADRGGIDGTHFGTDFSGLRVLLIPETENTITNSIGMRFKRIPAGKFLMGSPISEEGRDKDEHQHEVQITRDYYLGITEVTQSQWKKIMGTTPWSGEERAQEGADIAASYISWNDAVKFCEELSRKDGRKYRLPTEAEWEHSCRAETTTRYSFGNKESQLKEFAWYEVNAENVDQYYAHKVAQKRPNGFGLYDMHGNVYEFCQDWFGDYPRGSVTDPTGPSDGSRRVLRGGGNGSASQDCRSAYRNARKDPDSGFSRSGLRVLLVSDKKIAASGFTLDQARKLIIGTWKANLEETEKRTALDGSMRDAVAQLAIKIFPHGEFPKLEELDGENCFRFTDTFNGNQIVQEIQFLTKNRMIFKAADGIPEVVFDRVKETALPIKKLVGSYQHQEPKNDWHDVDIRQAADGNLIWKNAAGKSWSLSFKGNKLLTGPDCPYGEQPVEIVWGKKGEVSGVLFGVGIDKAMYFRQSDD